MYIPEYILPSVKFAITCYLDDTKEQIKKNERTSGMRLPFSRALHAELERWYRTEMNPDSLRGELELMDGTKIYPKKEGKN